MFKYPHILSCLPCSRCRVISRTFYKPTTLKPKPRGRGISVDTWSTFARLRLRKWLRVYEVCCSVLSTFLGHIKCNFQMQHLSVKALKEKSHLYLLCMLLLPKTLKSMFGIHISNVIMLFMVKTKLVLFKSDTTMKCWINDLSLDKNARWWISQLVLMTVFAVTEFLLELLSAYFTLLSNKS